MTSSELNDRARKFWPVALMHVKAHALRIKVWVCDDDDEWHGIANLALAGAIMRASHLDDDGFDRYLWRACWGHLVDHVRHVFSRKRSIPVCSWASRELEDDKVLPQRDLRFDSVDLWDFVDVRTRDVPARKLRSFRGMYGPDIDSSTTLEDVAVATGRARSRIHAHVHEVLPMLREAFREVE